MKIFDAISIAMLLGLSVILSITFFQAYSAGGMIEVHINEYGEAPYEAAIIILTLIMGSITLGRVIRRLV